MRQTKRRLSRPLRLPWKAPPNASGHETVISRSTRPDVASSTPPMILISVDFPAPLRPRMPSFWPRCTSKLTRLSTRRLPLATW